jgi:DNA repair protein RAD16
LLLSEPRRKPSLVVAPVVALMQWKHEIETHAEGFTTLLYHGSSKVSAEQLKKVDVVLTSYGTLEASFRRQHSGFKRGSNIIKETSALHSIEWFRYVTPACLYLTISVILDEAHNIKERSTNAAKAAFALTSSFKWCLSGTPLQNRVGELYSLVRFLGADPFSYYFCKKCPVRRL